ncbi:MAG: endonuclease/exonuclease/phosphatase family protein [Tannerellaceae bacterium]|nr:endonuclease/exonuclease/phosphatase family protein [Tannerellaceae bacterium]
MFFKAIRLIFKSIFVTANILAAVLLLMAAYSDRVAPETSLTFSYLGLAFPVFCFANLCFILYWLFLRKWKLTFISLVTFLLCWGPVKNYYPLHPRTQQVPPENVLKILSYNVMSFAFKDHSPEHPNDIVNYIAASDADIVCLQEYADYTSEKFITDAKLKKAFSMYPYRSIIDLNKNKNHRAGLAVYSKYPIQNSRKIDYDSDYNGSSIHEILIEGKKLTLINNHLESFKLTMEDKNRYSEFLKNAGSESFDGIKGTFQQKLGPAYIKRAEQARIVAGEIDKIESDYIVVCGDFNDTPISYAHRIVQGPLLDAFSKAGKGFGITFNENFFWFRIDHILYSPNMRAINCTVDKVKYSDHYPIWCYLEMN